MIKIKKSSFSISPFILLVISTFVLNACQSAKELHYFKSEENYYRLKINEWAFITSSRYISGYFDETAVNRYFGEILRPDSIAFISEIPENDSSPQNGEEELSPLEKDPDNTFVMILSTNSSAVADQISTLAKNEEILDMIARMANKEVLDENQQLMAKKKSLEDKTGKIRMASEQFIGTMDSLQVIENPDYLKSNLLSYLSYIATLSGETVIFDDFKGAKIWFQAKYTQ